MGHNGKSLPTLVQWPLAITRENAGWASIPQGEAKTRTYTLYAPDSGKQQSVKLKTPFSDSEYFVIEYRKQGKLGALNQLDSKIDGSGAIVYRVNPAKIAEGNKDNDLDYVYVFRGDETGSNRGDGVGGLRSAAIAVKGFNGLGSSNRSSIGSADLNDSLTDGAITYANGQNSGLVIEATAQTEDSITVSVTYPDYGAMDVWNSVSGSDQVLPRNDAIDVCMAGGSQAAYTIVQTGFSNNAVLSAYQITSDGEASKVESLGAIAKLLEKPQVVEYKGTLYV